VTATETIQGAFVVNTTADDATGVPGTCTSSPEGTCTLRDALAAGQNDGAGSITFDGTVFDASNSAAVNTITLIGGMLGTSAAAQAANNCPPSSRCLQPWVWVPPSSSA
jgi:CSLREA domain-containing protein